MQESNVRMRYFLHDDRGEIYTLSAKGEIFGGPNHIKTPSGQWRAVQLQHVVKTTWRLDILHILSSSDGWNIYARHKWFKNGKSQWYLIDFDHGSNRLWSRRVALSQVAQ
jgi:hypothetical protein